MTGSSPEGVQNTSNPLQDHILAQLQAQKHALYASRKGMAPIKQEYLHIFGSELEAALLSSAIPLDSLQQDKSACENSRNAASTKRPLDNNVTPVPDHQENAPPPPPPSKKAAAKKARGMNKAKDREQARVQVREPICHNFALGRCHRAECKYSHDVQAYLATKPADISNSCPLWEQYGHCRFGIKCRFLSGHGTCSSADVSGEPATLNAIPMDTIIELRKRTFPFTRSVPILKALAKSKKEGGASANTKGTADPPPISASVPAPVPEKELVVNASQAILSSESNTKAPESTVANPSSESIAIPLIAVEPISDAVNPASDLIDTPLTTSVKPAPEVMVTPSHAEKVDRIVDTMYTMAPERQKAPLNLRGKTYLAPLTTVGNLPFRRLCKDFGVDITCSEMAMASSLIQGYPSEWTLVKRHACEDVFGVQLAGSSVDVMTKAAEALEAVGTRMDFIDINMGCPVDAVNSMGIGASLLERKTRIFDICSSMSQVLRHTPLTVKLRTGVHKEHPHLAHTLMPLFHQSSVAAITLHGRTKAQRYTKLADWEYISTCHRTTHALDASIPFLGNGDILSHEEYYERLTDSGVDGIMIGRGALIKPWLFTEIKERRTWDISSSERLDILRRFAHYGLDHWGSDSQGVETTRRFLCEWLSFAHRYVPAGLLERLPQRMNDRPPVFIGRDELETRMGSSHAQEWVKLTELVLGKAPETFVFVPKHRSNSYEVGE